MGDINSENNIDFDGINESKTQEKDGYSHINSNSEFLRILNSRLDSKAEVEFGWIEEIRTHLALSRRQICLLLKLDPSAWSRWEKTESIPRSVFQALIWYVQLIHQNPQIHAPYGLEKKLQSQARENEMRIHHLKKEILQLKNQTTNPKSDAVTEIGEKVQESFENILLKFRDQMMPQKVFEIESLKYENRKLQDKLSDLQNQMSKLVQHLEKRQSPVSKEIRNKTKVKKRVKKALKMKLKPQSKVKKSRKKPSKIKKGLKNVGSSKKRSSKKS